MNDFFKAFYDFYYNLSSALKASIIVFIVLIIMTTVVGLRVKKLDYRKTPKGFTFIMIMLVDMINKMLVPIFPKYHKTFQPLLLTMFMYLVFANWASLVGLTAPLSNLNIALSMSIIVFATIQGSALVIKRPVARMKALLSPNPVFLPLNLIGEFSTPFSMGMRLFGNLMSGSILAILIYHFTSYVGIFIGAFLLHPVFDIFVGAIQAYVYLSLFSIFLAIAVED
ncbi:F0F1 ATP synthase subunit A [Paracholeplasma manati]|uniref:F0F1 ATP synthase subunit A n=1 Tax=Paracholeplasma manati TaxID=591373 RepID=A0ABT2Y7E5_9MOLU|nr:FoF1 ATP synthase subunit a [Paracholeplasma manati]MCV2232661.1 F0F1 ATP synthase subunit A [Paracholeplasma manati]MDG0889522.1 F0F1 ATP synthase subunit A [Paracholeplasma manati]